MSAEQHLPTLRVAVHSVVDLIGATPLVSLGRIHSGPGSILAKAEFLSPGGSVKDRAALHIVREARESNRLAPGQTVVEMTSGNMGAGLAIVCKAMGHPFIAVMSKGNSPARRSQMEAFGAEVVLAEQADGVPGQVTGSDLQVAVAEAVRIGALRGAFYVDQFNNCSGVRAHETTTGPEIWSQSQGKVDAFICSVGTGASLVGIARYLRGQNSRIQIFAVEPAKCRPLAGYGCESARHIIQGTGYGIVPPFCQGFPADGYLGVSDEEVRTVQKRLSQEEGLFVGPSAAANVCGAVKLARSEKLGASPTIITLLCDSGFKYI